MSLEHVTDHVERAVGRLFEQFNGKPNLEAIVSAFAEQAQEVEDALWQLVTLRTVETATGDQMDRIGEIVGQGREGKGDDEYRLLLKARIKINVSSGTAEDILGVMSAVLGTTPTVRLTEPATACLNLYVEGAATDADTAALLLRFLGEARAAGIGAYLHWSESAPEDTFTLDGVAPDQGLDNGHLADMAVS